VSLGGYWSREADQLAENLMGSPQLPNNDCQILPAVKTAHRSVSRKWIGSGRGLTGSSCIKPETTHTRPRPRSMGGNPFPRIFQK
jgi:hypothetical protein